MYSIRLLRQKATTSNYARLNKISRLGLTADTAPFWNWLRSSRSKTILTSPSALETDFTCAGPTTATEISIDLPGGFVRQNPDYHLVLTCNSIGRVLFLRLRLSLPPKDRHLNAYPTPLSSLAAFDLLWYFRLSKLSISFSLPSRSRFTYQNDMAPKFPVVQSTKKTIKLWFVSTRVQPWPQEWYVQS